MLNHWDPQTTPWWVWLLTALLGGLGAAAIFIAIMTVAMYVLEWALRIGRKADDEQ